MNSIAITHKTATERLTSQAHGIAILFTVLLVLLLPASMSAQQKALQHTQLFELGDGVAPAVPGIADVKGSMQAGPDWADLFDSNGAPRDSIGRRGEPGGNGVPDFLDSYGVLKVRRDVAFVRDDVSAAASIDLTARLEDGLLGESLVDAEHDIVNAYAYAAFGSYEDMLLFVGIERLLAADSQTVLELNQRPFAIGEDGRASGGRSIGDLRVRATFDGGWLSELTVWGWFEIDPDSETGGWVQLETLTRSVGTAEGCSDRAAVCAFQNASTIGAAAWPSYDATGAPASSLAPGTFLELGMNVGALLGADTSDLSYRSVQIWTPQDYALGSFVRASSRANGTRNASTR